MCYNSRICCAPNCSTLMSAKEPRSRVRFHPLRVNSLGRGGSARAEQKDKLLSDAETNLPSLQFARTPTFGLAWVLVRASPVTCQVVITTHGHSDTSGSVAAIIRLLHSLQNRRIKCSFSQWLPFPIWRESVEHNSYSHAAGQDRLPGIFCLGI